MRLDIQAQILNGLSARIDTVLTPAQRAQLQGLVSRGIKAVEVDENGHLIFLLTDDSTVDLGSVKGDKGDKGDPGTGFPDVTEADNNKIMRVIDGEWELSAFYSVVANPAGGNTLNI